MVAGNANNHNQPQNRTFSQFVGVRNAKHHPFIDKLIINNLSIVLAFGFYRLGLSANHVTALRGVLSIIYFTMALFLASDDIAFSILAIFLFAYLIYALDCADGQLARATKTESRFGNFFDICIDTIAHSLVYGGIFLYAYRYYLYIGDVYYMNLSIVVGLLFLISQTSRFFILHIYDRIYGDLLDLQNPPAIVDDVIMSAFGLQSQIFGILLFLVSPALAFLFFVLHTVVAAASCLRYLWRGHRAG